MRFWRGGKSRVKAKWGLWWSTACGPAPVNWSSPEVKWAITLQQKLLEYTAHTGREDDNTIWQLMCVLNCHIDFDVYWWAIVLSLQRGWFLKHTEQSKLWLLLLQWGYARSNRLLWPLGLWGDTQLLCSRLVSPFYPRLHGPGHWLERCFSAHTTLRGSDLNTSNNPARTSATAVEDWKHTRFFILDTAKMREYIVLVVQMSRQELF